MKDNTTVTYLNIMNNKGGDALATALGVMLKHNSALEHLDFDGNNFSVDGFKALKTGFMFNTTLFGWSAPYIDALSVRNHKSQVQINDLIDSMMEVMHRNKQRRDQAAQEATVGAPAGALSMGQVAEMIGKYTSRQHRPESQTMSLHTKKTVTQFKDYDADLPSTPSTPEPVADKFGFGPTSGGGSGNNLNWGTISSTTPTGLTTDKFDLDTVAERNKKMERETEASEAERETEAVSDPDEAL